MPIKTEKDLFATAAKPWFRLLLVVNVLFVSTAWAQYEIIQVGHGTGIANSIGISGQYAYIARGHGGLRVFDISNPASPVQVGLTTNLYDAAYSLVVRGRYVFATGYPRLQVYDVSDPSFPVKIGWVSGGASDGFKAIDVDGDIAFVGDGQILNTFDVSNVNSPSLLQTTNTQQYIWTLNVISGQASVSSNKGFGAWNVSDPANCDPIFYTNFLAGENSVTGAVNQNGFAYVGESRGDISIFDVSNLSAVAFVKRKRLASQIDGLALVGQRLLISASSFLLCDLSDPTNPVEVGRSAFRSDRGGGLTYAPRLVVRSNFIYTAEGYGMKIFLIAPKLVISKSSTNTAALTWPLPLAGEAFLQECTNLSAPLWTDVTNVPTAAGNQMKVELPLSSGSKYYRLNLKQ